MNIFGYAVFTACPERQAVVEAKKRFGNRPIIACEIGVLGGQHAEKMLENLNIKKLYLIDSYEKYEDYKEDNSYNKLIKSEKEARNRLKKYREKIIWIKEYSNDCIKKIPNGIDFLYIDGNHYSPYIDNDIKNYYPKVREGGIISGHDYALRCPDVMDAVFNLAKKLNKPPIFGRGTDWIFIKNNQKKENGN